MPICLYILGIITKLRPNQVMGLFNLQLGPVPLVNDKVT